MGNDEIKKKSTAGLILGIISLVLACIPVVQFVGLVCAIIGVVTSSKAKKMAYEVDVNADVATAGLIFSIIGVVVCGIASIACGVCFGGMYCIAGSLI